MADVPQVRIARDREAMGRYGVTPAQLGEAIDVAFAGEEVSQILEGQESYALVVRYDDASRGSLERIANARIDTPTGHQVPSAFSLMSATTAVPTRSRGRTSSGRS